MGRRVRARGSGQAPKHLKRPREYHHGETQGKVNESKIKRATPAFERADADRQSVEAEAKANRAEIADWRRLVDGLEHAAPFVPNLAGTIGALSGVEQSG